MTYTQLTLENLAQEHICCALSGKNDVQVASKKAWLAERLAEGLVFLKSTERGKCFIEYLPAEYAWNPIEAPHYLYIDCLWVSGALKGHGYSSDLLAHCLQDAREQGRAGVCILSTAKKRPFLADPKFLLHKGFTVADEADNGVQLWHLPLDPAAQPPRFRDCARHPAVSAPGYVLYYTSQCPFNAKYVPLLEKTAAEQGIPFQAIRLDTREAAQNAPTPITTYALFHDGAYLTNEQLNEARFLKLVGR